MVLWEEGVGGWCYRRRVLGDGVIGGGMLGDGVMGGGCWGMVLWEEGVGLWKEGVMGGGV